MDTKKTQAFRLAFFNIHPFKGKMYKLLCVEEISHFIFVDNLLFERISTGFRATNCFNYFSKVLSI